MIDLNSILDHFEVLKGERGEFESSIEDIKKYVCPRSQRSRDVFASSPSYASSVLACNLQSLIVNPSSKWFSVHLYDEQMNNLDQEESENEELLMWTQNIEDKLNEVFNFRGSNFFTQIHEFFLTLITYGTGVFYIEEDPKLTFCTFFRNIPLEECYFQENRLGLVDTMYREFKITLSAASNIWDNNAKLKTKSQQSPNDKMTLLHVTQLQMGKDDSYDSIYIDLDEREVLNEASYDYFPFLVTRWTKNDQSPYGLAPAHHVMPDIKLLNEYRQLGIKIKQKQVNPPLLVPRQGYMLPLNTAPGQVNFYDNASSDKIIPLSNLENIEATLDEQERCEIAIRAAFFTDLFHLPKENKEMTASEVSIRSQEQMRMLSPIVGRIESELLDPLIHSLFNILVKYKHIDLQGMKSPNIKLQYISPLSKAQKVESTKSIESLLGFIASSGAGNFAPEIYDNFNWDKMLKLFAMRHDCPQNIFKDQSQVDQIRRDREQKQEEMIEQQMQAQGR